MKKILVVLAVLAGIVLSGCVGENDMDFTATKRTTSAFNKDVPQLDVSAGKVYFVWEEPDVGGKDQIWTAVMNVDGTGFVATQRTTSAFDKTYPQLQVSGSKIYYVWREPDAANDRQIWTAVMNVDGTDWIATKRTDTTVSSKRGPYLQVVGTKIYYVWREKTDAGEYSIWTASMDTDGSNWSANKRQVISLDGTQGVLAWIVRQHVVGSKIYYVWVEHDGADYEIWTAVMDIDGSNWIATKRRTSSYDIRWVTLYVYGSTIYYAWAEKDGASLAQIWTGMMGTDGTNWTATKRTEGDWWLYNIELAASGNTVYYACTRVNSVILQTQVWTAEMNVDGSSWKLTQRTFTDSQYRKRFIQQKIGSDIHYVWKERDDDDYWQIWTGKLPLPPVDKEAPWKEDTIVPGVVVEVEIPRRSGNWIKLEDIMRIHTSSGKNPFTAVEIGQAEIIVSNISKNFNSFNEASDWYKSLEGYACRIFVSWES